MAATDWPNVISVRVHLTLSAAAQELSATGTMVRIEREFFNVVALRNRVS